MSDHAAALKQTAFAALARDAQRVIDVSDAVLRHPETGFREVATARLVATELARLGLEVETGLALTGVKARLASGRPGPTVAVIGELDSLAVAGHPFCDPDTGYAHACGHNAQVAAMIGAAIALQAVIDRLDGDIVLLGVPAEEAIEIEWRLAQRELGAIECIVGKPELIRLGAFDDVDLAIASHAVATEADGPAIEILAGHGTSANGSLLKLVTFTGQAAHSGHAPWAGIDAQKALTLAIAAIDAQRDTFADADHVRVHHLVTSGGVAVSSVPAEARMELMVRAATVDGLYSASQKVDRALRAGASAIGAGVEIRTVVGNFPYIADGELDEVIRAAAIDAVGPDEVRVRPSPGHSGAGTDLGDLSQIMPVLTVLAGGANPGTAPHEREFFTLDQERSAVAPAKAMAALAIDLLVDDAVLARRALAGRPRLIPAECLRLRRGLEGTQRHPAVPLATPNAMPDAASAVASPG